MENKFYHVRTRSLVFVITACLVVAPRMSEAFYLPDLLPDDGDVEGWVREGDYKYPQTADSLYIVINGAAGLFLRHDFKGAVFQDYRDTASVILSLEIFDQTTEAQAGIVYDSTGTGLEEPVEGLGDEARMAEHLFDFQIEFRRGEFYIKGTVMNKTNPYKIALRDFMLLVDNRIITPVQRRNSWGELKARHR